MSSNYFNYLPQYQLAAAVQYLYEHKNGTTVENFNNFMNGFAGDRSMAKELLDIFKEFKHIFIDKNNNIIIDESLIHYYHKKYLKE